MKRKIVVLVGLALVACGAGISSAQVVVTVPGTSGPWQWDATLNASYPYAQVIPSEFAPTTSPGIVSAANGIPFIPGDVITFNYLSGLVTGAYYRPWWDANGDTQGGEGSPQMYGLPNYGYSPGYYIPPVGGALVNFMELVGTFTDAAGAIVGDPCVIGDSCALSIPIGATQFQLGVNDDNYPDNSGSLSIGVSEVPEPSFLTLFGVGVIGLLACAWRRKRFATIPCILFLTAAVAVPAVSAQTNIINLSTGLDSSNKVFPSGGENDAHWTVESGQVGVFAPAVTVDPSNPDWLPGWPDNSSGSDWIARTTDFYQGAPAPPYEFRRTFDLTGYDLSSVTITGSWTIDDLGTLNLNGNIIGDLTPWPWTGWPDLQQFSVPQSYLNQGENVLSISLGAIYGSDNQQDGVRLEGYVSYVPEPSSFILLGAGAVTFLAYIWRRGKRTV